MPADPRNRQGDRFAYEGVDLGVSTLADWVGGCTAALAPLVALETGEVWSIDTDLLAPGPRGLPFLEALYAQRLATYSPFLANLRLAPPFRRLAGLISVEDRRSRCHPHQVACSWLKNRTSIYVSDENLKRGTSFRAMNRSAFMIGLLAGALVADVAAVHAFPTPMITADSDVKSSDSCNDCIQSVLDRVGMDSAQKQARDVLQRINVFGPDDRIPQTRRPVGGHGTGYSAVGRIFSNRIYKGGLRATGTAFLISPCVAMTNYHVVFGDDGVEALLPYAKELNRQFKENRDSVGNVKITLPNDVDYSMTFLVGENPDGTFKREVVGRPVAFGNMENRGGVAYDWVAIKFDEPHCPGADPEIGWLDLDASSQAKIDQMDLHIAGYASAHNHHLITERMTLDRSSRPCHSYGQRLEQEAMAHDCPSTDGQSGGPIFYIEDGKFNVVGMNRGASSSKRDEMLPNYDRGSRDFEKYANEAVGVRAFLPEVLPIIDRDLAAHGLGPAREQ